MTYVWKKSLKKTRVIMVDTLKLFKLSAGVE